MFFFCLMSPNIAFLLVQYQNQRKNQHQFSLRWKKMTLDPLTITMGISTELGFKGIYRQQNRLATCAKFCQSLFLSFIITSFYLSSTDNLLLLISLLFWDPSVPIRFLLLFCWSQVFVRLRDEALPSLEGFFFQGWKYERIPLSQVGCCAPVHSSSQ